MNIMGFSSLLISLTLLQSGSWRGYVTGWVSDPNSARQQLTVPQYRLSLPQQYVWLSQLAYEQSYTAQMNAALLEKEAARQLTKEQLFAQQRLNEQQSQFILQQQTAQTQEQLRFALERERQALKERAALEIEKAALNEKIAAFEQKALEEKRLLAAKEQEVVAREAARLAQARAEEKSDPPKEIFRWVDEDGIIHFSSKPRGKK
jgi:hypothetical protein